ncbi:hypothetical protein BVRB_7g169960 [Beta vulgaris subsp. vulgaris]|nr:hypothetical protein BVRB_7g169960 [Beta vulgaris subsp. vulgaris]
MEKGNSLGNHNLLYKEKINVISGVQCASWKHIIIFVSKSEVQ